MSAGTHFGGETFDAARDGARLSVQYDRVFELMADGEARTLEQIAQATGYPTHSVSARLRDMRKPRFGAHLVEREHVARGLFRYRVTLNTCPDLI